MDDEDGRDELAVEADPEADHGFLESLEGEDGDEENGVGREGDGGDEEAVVADGDDRFVVGEETKSGLAEKVEDEASDEHDDGSEFDVGYPGFADAVGEFGSVVLADDAEGGEVEADGRHEDDLFNTHGDSGGGNGFLIEVLHKPIDDKHPDGDGEHVESSGDCLARNFFEDGPIGGEFPRSDFFEELGFLKMGPKINDAAEMDDESSERKSGHAHFWEAPPAEDEEWVEEAVGNESCDEVVAIRNGVALGREGGVEDDWEKHENGSGEDDVHVVETGLEIASRCSERVEDDWGGGPSGDGHDEGADDDKEDGLCEVASAVAGVPFAESIGQESRGALADAAADRKDDEKDGEGEGEGGEGFGADLAGIVGVHHVEHGVEEHPNTHWERDSPDER